MYVRPSTSGRAWKRIPSAEVATRETWRPTPSSPWKYMTIRRPSASTCTSGEAMCGVVTSVSRSCEIRTPPRRAARRASSSGETSGGSVRKCESSIRRLPGGWIRQGPRRSSA